MDIMLILRYIYLSYFLMSKKKADRGVLHPLRKNLLIVTILRWGSHLCVALILR